MIMIYCSLTAVITALVFINSLAKRKKIQTEALWAAKWIQQLRLLLELLPKHRGMANALLKGDGSFRQPLRNLQCEVDAQLEAMRRLNRDSGDQSASSLLTPIEREWLAIRDNVFALRAGESFTMHTRLIARVIERMEDDSLILERLSHNDEPLRSLLTVLTHDLPHIVESIGQARGIGTGVAAQRTSSVANRVNLKFLQGKTSSIVNSQLSMLRLWAGRYQNLGIQFSDVVENAILSAQCFSATMQDELIDKPIPAIAPEKFYQQGTAAIEAGFQLFDKLYPSWLQALGLQFRAV